PPDSAAPQAARIGGGIPATKAAGATKTAGIIRVSGKDAASEPSSSSMTPRPIAPDMLRRIMGITVSLPGSDPVANVDATAGRPAAPTRSATPGVIVCFPVPAPGLPCALADLGIGCGHYLELAVAGR